MDLADFLLDVAYNYARGDGLNTPTQQLLKDAAEHLGEHVPAGILIKGSGGKGVATFTPWIGVFDPDETVSPENGVYVVYLFAEDLASVALTLNQGITQLTNELGAPAARRRLALDAENIRAGMPASSLTGLDTAIHLSSSGFRQKAYEAGNIVSTTYTIDTIPDEPTLRRDIARFLDLYELAVDSKRALLLARPGLVSTASGTSRSISGEDDPLRNFKPKDDSDYIATLSGRTLVKTRRHETLVTQYGEVGLAGMDTEHRTPNRSCARAGLGRRVASRGQGSARRQRD
jgi:MrcB-like, N-terminal domain